jgi:hypothetical protein
LRRVDGRTCLRDRAVDVVFRQFMVEDIADDDASAALLEPLLSAAEAGEVRLFTPLDAELYGSKSALALLSEAQSDQRLDVLARGAIGRLIPWTRIVRAGTTTLPDGTTGELFDYAIARRDELAIKPSFGHGGDGMVAGWAPEMTDAQWRDRLDAALSEPYVIQRRVRPVPEQFPAADGMLEPWTVTWGVFTLACGYAGTLLRCAPHSDSNGAINHGTGARMGCCFHAV